MPRSTKAGKLGLERQMPGGKRSEGKAAAGPGVGPAPPDLRGCSQPTDTPFESCPTLCVRMRAEGIVSRWATSVTYPPVAGAITIGPNYITRGCQGLCEAGSARRGGGGGGPCPSKRGRPPPMDTKTQSLPNTHAQPHSNSRPQSHACHHCSCSQHCQSRCRSRSCRSRSSNRRPRSHRSPAGRQGQSPGPSPPLRRHRHTMHSHQCPSRPVTHSCSHSKNRKNLEGKVIKRKQVKRSKQVYKKKRQSSGTCQAGGLSQDSPREGRCSPAGL